MYITKEIKSPFELPYKLIDIFSGDESFVLEFTRFDEGQSDYSIQAGGVTGQFGIVYKGRGIDARFECDLTMGNLYAFDYALDTSYDIMFGKNSSAVLCDYSEPNHTFLEFVFDEKGKCHVKGDFKNQENFYHTGLQFEFDIDQIFIPEILAAMDTFFTELKKIQERGTFMEP